MASVLEKVREQGVLIAYDAILSCSRARRVMLFASRECTTIRDFDVDQHVGTAMHT